MSNAPMTPIEALTILHCYQRVAYRSAASDHIVSEARKVLDTSGTALMQRLTGGLCDKCWGDGLHRRERHVLAGPCEKCGGSGRRETPADVAKDAGTPR